MFSFQSWTKADDIRDFEIEGMSIGDSLLDYYSKEEIKIFHTIMKTILFQSQLGKLKIILKHMMMLV